MMPELDVSIHFLMRVSYIPNAQQREIMIHLGATIHVDQDIGIIVATAR